MKASRPLVSKSNRTGAKRIIRKFKATGTSLKPVGYIACLKLKREIRSSTENTYTRLVIASSIIEMTQ